VNVTFTGSAGQGFAAFLEPGLSVTLVGEANDSVCKSMSGGTVVIRPPAEIGYTPEENGIIGNCALYGATGGELFVNGLAGDRFAVRNSGAVAVVEGVGLHACEYMTGGTVVIVHGVSHNVGAGMTGGTLFLRREKTQFVNSMYVAPTEMTDDDVVELRRLLERHRELTGSQSAAAILEDWRRASLDFVRCLPLAMLALRPEVAPRLV
jgi:glutamate synthase domain-containing protein 3